MLDTIAAGGIVPPVVRLHVGSKMAASIETVESNIRGAMARGLPQFDRLPEFTKFKGDAPLAIVGGGPSLKDTIDELRSFRHVMVCGSAHDYVVGYGIEPRYAVLLDADPIMANYIANPVPTCTYLVASQCPTEVFDKLQDFPVAVWHASGTGLDKLFIEQGRTEATSVGGGCTVTLRALNLAILMGYRQQHYFGMDSCFAGNEHHAYAAEDVVTPFDVHIPETGRVFMCAPYMAAQAEQFLQWLRDHGSKYVDPIAHGDGLIAELLKVWRMKIAAKQESACNSMS